MVEATAPEAEGAEGAKAEARPNALSRFLLDSTAAGNFHMVAVGAVMAGAQPSATPPRHPADNTVPGSNCMAAAGVAAALRHPR